MEINGLRWEGLDDKQAAILPLVANGVASIWYYRISKKLKHSHILLNSHKKFCKHRKVKKLEADLGNDTERLIIVGSGNVAWNVYRFAALLGDYRITVIDNRAETLTLDRFPEAGELLLGDIVDILKACDISETTSIVLASYNHEFDLPALQAIVKSPARYIGALGNRHKVTAYFSQLDAMGISEELMGRVHVPIGLDIGGYKAAEIALSVMAEIQSVKYERPGGFVILQNERKGIGIRDELF